MLDTLNEVVRKQVHVAKILVSIFDQVAVFLGDLSSHVIAIVLVLLLSLRHLLVIQGC